MTEQRIELAEYIRDLRRQVTKASEESKGKSVRFEVEALELELHTVAERSEGGEAGIRFWIASLGGKTAVRDQSDAEDQVDAAAHECRWYADEALPRDGQGLIMQPSLFAGVMAGVGSRE